MGFLPLHEMGPKMGQLCGMQTTIQLHQMACDSIFKKFIFCLFIWNFDALNALKFFRAMNTLKNFGAMSSLHFFGVMNSLHFFGAMNSVF